MYQSHYTITRINSFKKKCISFLQYIYHGAPLQGGAGTMKNSSYSKIAFYYFKNLFMTSIHQDYKFRTNIPPTSSTKSQRDTKTSGTVAKPSNSLGINLVPITGIIMRTNRIGNDPCREPTNSAKKTKRSDIIVDGIISQTN